MCGIVGIYLRKGQVDPAAVRQMNAALVHRGPDGEGYFIDGSIGLGMRRLAIIDLQTGDQPIFNEDKSVVVIFNGEIYNYQTLRAQLQAKGHTFRTQSDTEVLVHGYEEWGDNLPHHLNGMFAFALWDARRQRLFLARDHLGIKPLYYVELPGGGIAFASELKALYPLQSWSRELDPVALDWFLATRYIPAPRSIYRHVRKLPPAHYLTLGTDEPLRLQRYWDVSFAPQRIRTWPQYLAELQERLSRAVRRQMISDVPLGAFLSGGIDSSIVVSLMAQESTTPVHTFSVVFPGWPGLDESPYARLVANRFQTAHTEIVVETDVAHEWPLLARSLDEPFADPATFPTWLMARETRRHITVVLTGEGADELFAGYNWYGWPKPWPMPIPLRKSLRRLAQSLLAGRRGRHYATARLSPDFATFYAQSILSSVTQAEERVRLYRPEWLHHLEGLAPEIDLAPLFAATDSRSWQSRIQELDLKVWLEGDPLVKADRATMLASLEARVPFLDVEVVEWAAQILPFLHRREGVSKALLRAAFEAQIPQAIQQRPKHAFDVPIAAWLRGPLRPHLAEALSEASPIWQLLQPEPIRRMAQFHWQGRRDFARELWAILHLALWWNAYGP
ncbi:MAG: asparagine synthase (glutamine-hydrolyzing) [Chloroflexi bacterium]|nr:asparagine synthase (glutamine-hydrolyzing) [Chloroflexota bacterium]